MDVGNVDEGLGSHGMEMAETPPPLPPRPVYRIRRRSETTDTFVASESSIYQYPAMMIFDDGVGEAVLRVWSQVSR